TQGPSHRPADLGHFQYMGEPGAIVVALGGDEHLGLGFQAPKGLGVNNALPILLEAGGIRTGLLLIAPAPALAGLGRIGRQVFFLPFQNRFNESHLHPSPSANASAPTECSLPLNAQEPTLHSMGSPQLEVFLPC